MNIWWSNTTNMPESQFKEDVRGIVDPLKWVLALQVVRYETLNAGRLSLSCLDWPGGTCWGGSYRRKGPTGAVSAVWLCSHATETDVNSVTVMLRIVTVHHCRVRPSRPSNYIIKHGCIILHLVLKAESLKPDLDIESLENKILLLKHFLRLQYYRVKQT